MATMKVIIALLRHFQSVSIKNANKVVKIVKNIASSSLLKICHSIKKKGIDNDHT